MHVKWVKFPEQDSFKIRLKNKILLNRITHKTHERK